MEIKAFLDRIEGDKAVLQDGEEREAVLPAAWIPGAHEGQAVTLRIEDDPARETAARDEAEALLADLLGSQK